MQKAVMRADVQPSTIKAVLDVFLKNKALLAAIAMFVSNYVEMESNRVKNGNEIFWTRDKDPRTTSMTFKV